MGVFVCFCTFLHTVRKNVEALWLWLCVWLPQEAKHHETTGLKWRHSASFKTSPKLHQQWQILKNEYDKFVRSSSGATCSRLTYRITSHKQNNARTRHQQHGWHAGGEKSQVLVSKLSYTDYIRLQWKKHVSEKHLCKGNILVWTTLTVQYTCSPTKRCLEDTGANSFGRTIFFCVLLRWYWFIMPA